MSQIKFLVVLSLAVAAFAQVTNNNGIEYDGTSNVRRSPTSPFNYTQPPRVTPALPFTNSAAPVTPPTVPSYPSQYPPRYRPVLQPHPIILSSQSPQVVPAPQPTSPSVNFPNTYRPVTLNSSLPVAVNPPAQPGVIYEPKIIFVPKITQPETPVTEFHEPATQPPTVTEPPQTPQPEVVIQPVATPQPEIAPQPEIVTPQPEIITPQPEIVTPQPEIVTPQPEFVPLPEPTRQPEVIPEPVQVIPEPVQPAVIPETPQPEVLPTPEPFNQPQVIPQPQPTLPPAVMQPVVVRQPEATPQPQPPRQSVTPYQPQWYTPAPVPVYPSNYSVANVSRGTLLPLLPKQQPEREPVYGRPTHPTPTIYNPTPSYATRFPPTQFPTQRPPLVTRVPPTVVTRVPPTVATRLPPVVTRYPTAVVTRQPPTVTTRYPPAVVTTPSPTVVPTYPPLVVASQPTTVTTRYPPTIVTRPSPTVVPTYPPVVVTRPPPVTRVPPTVSFTVATTRAPVYIVTPAPIGPFKMEFQCPESDGFFSVANSCEAYYECKGYVPQRRICPNSLYFNPAAKYSNSPCAYPSEVQCSAAGKVIPRPQPNNNPSGSCPAPFGSYAINDGDCSRFIMCQEGLSTIMTCPLGLVFNDQTQVCDWPANVPQCHPAVFKDFSCPAPPVDRNGDISDTVYNYRYGSQCKAFISCQRGQPRLLSCDAGLAFDEASQSCIGEELVRNCATPYSAAVV